MQIAIVTGASSGLGAAFAHAVTREYKCLDEIWLIARRGDRLEQIASEHPKQQIRILALDLTEDESYERLEEILRAENPEIRILINNAGYECTGRFEDVPTEELDRMIALNVLAATRLQKTCDAYLTPRSVSILTASVLAYVPTSGQAVYSASKSYLYSLGRSLREEYRDHHGNVLTLCPGSMDTAMNPRWQNPNARRFPFLYTDVDDIAVKALYKAERGTAVYTPGWFYKTWRIVAKILPQSLLIWIVGRAYRK